MKNYIKIDETIQRGSELIQNRQTTKGCDTLLEAWEGIKGLLNDSGAKDIFELERMYPFTDYLSNYAQELVYKLHNAGVDNPSYHGKCIKYCTELLEYCGDHQVIIENTRRAIAEAYSFLDEMETCDRLFEEWLRGDPNWGWGYIGWSDCYCLFKTSSNDYEKGENILHMALAQPGLRDKVDVIARLIDIYTKLQNTGKVHEYKALLRKTMPEASPTSLYYKPAPIIKPDKTGRNEPCPCGSGKKHKKCCGAKMVV